MFMPVGRLAALALVVATLAGGRSATALEAARFETRLDTYHAGDGADYFVLRLVPNVAVEPAAVRDIAILVDTSASQTGVARGKALDALTTLLAGLDRSDRVSLVAVDLEAVPLTQGFVSAQGSEIDEALSMLRARTPLGATDLPRVLTAAVDSFDAKSAADKAVVYIGDGVSAARFLDTPAYRRLIDRLVDGQVSVSSYGVGPRVDGMLLASLANHTGGMLALDGESVDPKQAGAYLATAAHTSVLWPSAVTWPSEFKEILPERLPALRADRDTIVLGIGKPVGEQTISVTATAHGQPQSLKWTVSAGESNPDFSYLPTLVESARADGGARLSTLGTPGLNEVRRVLEESTETLARLSGQAISSGNLPTAERLADEALKRDPSDPTAQAVKKQLAKIRAGEADAKEPKLEVKRSQSEQAAPPSPFKPIAYRKPTPDDADLPTTADVNDGQGQYLRQIDQQRRLITAQVRAEVENELRDARGRMANEPAAVEQSLKLMMERVVHVPELQAEVRAQLRGQLETALREANRRNATKEILDAQMQAERAAAEDRLRIVRGLDRDQEKLKQLMDRFESLMDEGRYAAADNIGSIEVPEVAPDTPIAASAGLVAHLVGAYTANKELRTIRQKAVVDTLWAVETSLVPFPDDQPVVYPDAAVWEELSARRKKYKDATDLKEVGPAEKKIRSELDEPTTMEFIETPLQDAVDYLKDLHGIEIQLDGKALEEAGVGSDTPVTRTLKGISLRSALRLMLGEMELTYVIKDEVLLITTTDKASNELVTKAYPVADLVIPIRSGGGMGGGMGGMGGGMGGMGGGMGGMFNVADELAPSAFQAFDVKDDLKLTPKKSPTAIPATGKPAGAKPAAAKPATAAPAAAKPAAAKPATNGAAKTAKPAVKVTPIELKIAEGADPNVAWNDYFAAHPDVAPEQVRETARQLVHAKKYEQAIAMVHAALRNGAPQPWMYEALSLAMQAAGRPISEVERALTSAIDFAESPEDFMYVAQYMARMGMERRALTIFHQVSLLDPLRPEPYLFGLQLAQRTGDAEGMQWASLGILRQAWPKDKQELVASAARTAAAVVEQLKKTNRSEEAATFEAQLAEAKVRDCVVKVTWTGSADVDLMVEEPTSTICSFRNPRTAGGGVLLGDTSARKVAEGLSETYICPEAFNGTYKVRLSRIWGKVTAGKVTVDVYSNYGSQNERHIRQQIPLGEEDQLLVFDLTEGRRKEALADYQLAQAATVQMGVNQAILSQQIASEASTSGGNAALVNSRQGLIGVPFIQQAVGYMPVITVLPSGTMLQVNGVVSADRRYVRISPTPFFSGISSVTTFNLLQGATSTTSGSGTGGTPPGGTPPGGNPNQAAAGS